jgi:nicotinamide-nucleotide amidase
VFESDNVKQAQRLMQCLNDRGMMMVTAESCTGGLIAALMTELPGSSTVFDRSFVTYSNAAKSAMLDVTVQCLADHGAVSRETALAMADGALKHSRAVPAKAMLAVAVTGVAGPSGGSVAKPVGLVHIAAAMTSVSDQSQRAPLHRECRFGDLGRDAIRMTSVRQAIDLALALIDAE